MVVVNKWQVRIKKGIFSIISKWRNIGKSFIRLSTCRYIKIRFHLTNVKKLIGRGGLEMITWSTG